MSDQGSSPVATMVKPEPNGRTRRKPSQVADTDSDEKEQDQEDATSRKNKRVKMEAHANGNGSSKSNGKKRVHDDEEQDEEDEDEKEDEGDGIGGIAASAAARSGEKKQLVRDTTGYAYTPSSPFPSFVERGLNSSLSLFLRGFTQIRDGFDRTHRLSVVLDVRSSRVPAWSGVEHDHWTERNWKINHRMCDRNRSRFPCQGAFKASHPAPETTIDELRGTIMIGFGSKYETLELLQERFQRRMLDRTRTQRETWTEEPRRTKDLVEGF